VASVSASIVSRWSLALGKLLTLMSTCGVE
jgi:hypothetical protein